jgi:hypothetical protein
MISIAFEGAVAVSFEMDFVTELLKVRLQAFEADGGCKLFLNRCEFVFAFDRGGYGRNREILRFAQNDSFNNLQILRCRSE